MPCRRLMISLVKPAAHLDWRLVTTWALHRLPPILKQFAQQYPNVTLDIEFMDSEKAYEQVLHGDSEVAVITLALEAHHNINSKKIWNDPLRFICAQDHPLAQIKTAGAKRSGRVSDYFAGVKYLYWADYSESISEGRHTVKGTNVD